MLVANRGLILRRLTYERRRGALALLRMRKIAPWHFSIPFCLSILGLALLYSTTYEGRLAPSRLVLLQSLWILTGIIIYRFISRLRISARPRSPHLFFWPVWLLLISTLFVGLAVQGSSRWLRLGPLQIQPSEFAKVFAVLLLAYLFSDYSQREESRRFALAGAIILAFSFPILQQPDLGTAALFILLFLAILFVKPLPKKYLLGIFVALLIVLVPGWFLLEDYQRGRIIGFFQPAKDPLGVGYHVNQSKIAIGSGGLFGKGFLHGTQTQGEFIPVQSADFIFATLGEEWGFVGGVFVLCLYAAIILKGFSLARRVRSDYERLLVLGSIAVLFFQVFINVGMTIGIMPVTGLPLPFLSYGGSSMVTMWSFMGILASLEKGMRPPIA